MVAPPQLRPIWTPVGLLQRSRRLLRQPGDVLFTLRIGLFVWRLPRMLQSRPLPELLDRLRAGRRPAAPDVDTGLERIIRLRKPWLRKRRLGSHNTCYVRALSLYRFLDAGDHDLRIHFVAEPARVPDERRRGHAWVTVDNRILEDPEHLREEGLTHEVYSHPEPKTSPMTANGAKTHAGVRTR